MGCKKAGKAGCHCGHCRGRAPGGGGTVHEHRGHRAQHAHHEHHGHHGGRKLFAVVGLGLVAAAVAKELQKPKSERTWQGELGPVPYDFRVPTPERITKRLWDPEGPAFGPRIFGIGWTPNLGRLVQEVNYLVPWTEADRKDASNKGADTEGVASAEASGETPASDQ